MSLQVAPKHVVNVHYTLTEKTADGKKVESTIGAEPLVFIYGTGNMIPDFEKNIAGLKAGDKFAFGIPAKDAYGEYDAEEVAEVDKQMFADPTGKIPDEVLVVGNGLALRDPNGRRVNAIVKSVAEKTVTLDFNHPMAGIDLFFTGHIEAVRAAEENELAHGHVHGPGGHHH